MIQRPNAPQDVVKRDSMSGHIINSVLVSVSHQAKRAINVRLPCLSLVGQPDQAVTGRGDVLSANAGVQFIRDCHSTLVV